MKRPAAPLDDPSLVAELAAAIKAKTRRYRGHALIGSRPDYFTVKVGSGFSAAHRVVYAAAYGPPPADRPWVLHRCVGYRNCVRVEHLYAGTALQNAADTVAAGRSTRGERHAHAKLTARQVRAARAARRRGARLSEIAARYGIHYSTLRSAVTGENWAWL